MRITREIGIDMGHRVPNHGSKCKNLHGHRYRVIATVQGGMFEVGEQEGMVIDFGFLKEEMMLMVDAFFDHGMALWIQDPILVHELGPTHERIADDVFHHGYALGTWKWGKIVVTRDVPTAENLAKLWYELLYWRLADRMEGTNGRLYSITVWETPNCSAIYKPNVSPLRLTEKA